MKIAHLTSVHPRYDTRIFLKECRSLKRVGHSVSLVVADGRGDEQRDGIFFYDVGLPAGRLSRMFKTTQKVFCKALEINADVYHLHDPELIPVGIRLKWHGKKVIFDAHEDVPKQLMGKPYLNKLSKVILSHVFRLFEAWACKKFDAVVTATPTICEKFLKINDKSLAVNNFPMIGELAVEAIDWSQKKNEVSYIGGIAAIRGVSEVVKAMALVTTNVKLQLGGRFSEKNVEAAAKRDPGWVNVDELGFVSREEVRDALARSVAGLVTFLPAPNHIDAQPNKMFEYMSAGVPVIASNFSLWREIVEGNDCGVCVDPLNPVEIAEAVDFMVKNPDRAEEMGRNGQRAVYDKYNWAIEEQKLFDLYARLA